MFFKVKKYLLKITKKLPKVFELKLQKHVDKSIKNYPIKAKRNKVICVLLLPKIFETQKSKQKVHNNKKIIMIIAVSIFIKRLKYLRFPQKIKQVQNTFNLIIAFLETR